jgi:hypothetical protein
MLSSAHIDASIFPEPDDDPNLMESKALSPRECK